MNRLKWRIVDRLCDLAGEPDEPETVTGGDCEAGSGETAGGRQTDEARPETQAEGED